MCAFTPKISGNTIIPRLGVSPAGCASHASIVVPSSTLISTCCEVMFDIAAKRLSHCIGAQFIMTARFDSPRAIVTGGGCRAQAADLLLSLHAERTLLVVDPFFAAAEFVNEIR